MLYSLFSLGLVSRPDPRSMIAQMMHSEAVQGQFLQS
jgi:hypothetical protein